MKKQKVVPPPTKPRNSFYYGEPRKGFTVHVDPKDFRVTTAEREECAAELSRQFAAGRLDQATFDSRITTALSATVR